MIIAAAIVLLGVVAAAAISWTRSRDAAPTGTTPAEPAATLTEAWFADVTDQAGIAFTHVRSPVARFWFPEIMGGGGAFLDYDGDGLLDVYLVQSGELAGGGGGRWTNRLYRNLGDGRFQDVTEASGAGDSGYGMGCACGDADGDGDTDIYISNVGPDVLLRNNGDGTFTDATSEAGLGDPGWGTSCAFVDYDGDADLDLFVTRYVNWAEQREIECRSGSGERDYCKPTNYNAPAIDVLYRNDGGGVFTDVTAAAGLEQAYGNGLGVACGDFDADGRVDIYVANDGNPNQLWINQGNGRFIDNALAAGCAVNMQGVAEAGMGVAAVDIEHDGDLDLFMTHLRDETNTFYENRGGTFLDTTALSGLSAKSIRYTGFGMGFADFDLDGTLDVFIANGRVGRWEPAPSPTDPYAEPNQLYHGTSSGRFEEISATGETVMGNSRGAAFGDYDNDGDVDVLVINNHGTARLMRNTIGDGGNGVVLRIRDRSGGDALGARVEATTPAGTQRRIVQAAFSYCSSNDPRVHFGLGEATEVTVTVTYPDGFTESFGPIAAGSNLALVRGSGR